MAICKSCKSLIIWRRTVNGKAIPINRSPVHDGNIWLDGEIARVVKPGYGVYKSHFDTCPDADKYRSSDG